MRFVEECIQESMPIWKACLETDFLKGIADGSLSEECFKGYIVEDSLYLREYVKVFAWGMIHTKTMDEIRMYYSLLSFVNESEDATRLYYIKRYELNDETIQTLPLRKENQDYVNTMIEVAQNGSGAPECMMACLPCMLSYGWIFRELLKTHPKVKETPFGRLVVDYAGDGYDTLCKEWITFANEVCEALTDEQKKHCKAIFYKCSVHEYHFWEMSAKPRLDV